MDTNLLRLRLSSLVMVLMLRGKRVSALLARFKLFSDFIYCNSIGNRRNLLADTSISLKLSRYVIVSGNSIKQHRSALNSTN